MLATSDTITLDTAGPTGTMAINSGALYTTSPNVTLNSDVTGATEMRFTNDGTLDTEAFEAYSPTKAWTLAAGDGAKTVNAEYRDAAGNVLATSDTITLDTAGPTGSMAINGGATYTKSATVLLTLSAADATQMQFSNDGTSWSSPVPYATSYAYSLPGADGPKTVYVRYIDTAGNTGPTASGQITLDTKIDHALFLSAPGDVVRNARFTVSGSLKPLAAAGRNIVVTAYLNGVPRRSVTAVKASYRNPTTGEVYTRFSARMALPTKGAWVLKATVGGDETHNPAESLARVVNVNRPRLSLASTRSSVAYNNSAVLTGYLKARNGSALAGRTVVLDQSSDGKTWKRYRSLKTSSTGKVSAKVRPEKTAYYRFRFVGDRYNMTKSSIIRRITPAKYAVSGTLKDRYYQTRSFYLSKGQHRMRVKSSAGLRTVWISRWDPATLKYTDRTRWKAAWSLVDTDDLRAGQTATYYITVPTTSRYYFVEIENSIAGMRSGNDLFIEVW